MNHEEFMKELEETHKEAEKSQDEKVVTISGIGATILLATTNSPNPWRELAFQLLVLSVAITILSLLSAQLGARRAIKNRESCRSVDSRLRPVTRWLNLGAAVSCLAGLTALMLGGRP